MQLAKIAVIVNPTAGGGLAAKRWPDIAAALKEEGLNYKHSFTDSPGHATGLTRHYLKKGYQLIVSVGGDGTNNEVVNGFFHQDEAVNNGAAVSFISSGTGSDLIRTLGIPKDYKKAIRHLINSPVRTVDVGKVAYVSNGGTSDSRYFINIAGLGLDAETVGRVNRTSKALGGFISFFWGTFISLLLYHNREMVITVDGKVVCNEPVTTILIGNGRYAGGGMQLAPFAKMDDGLFDIVIMKNLKKSDLLFNLPHVYKGRHIDNPKILFLRGRSISVASLKETLLNLDGEQPGKAPVDIELLQCSIKIKG